MSTYTQIPQEPTKKDMVLESELYLKMVDDYEEELQLKEIEILELHGQIASLAPQIPK